MLQGIRPAFKFNVVIVSIYLIKRGENMLKKLSVFFVSAILCISIIPTTKVNAKANTGSYEPMSIEYIINQVGATVYIGGLAIINIDGTVTRDAQKNIIDHDIHVYSIDRHIKLDSVSKNIIGKYVQITIYYSVYNNNGTKLYSTYTVETV